MVDNSLKYADEQMKDIQELGKYMQDDVKEKVLNIIRLELISAYRKGWNDSRKYYE